LYLFSSVIAVGAVAGLVGVVLQSPIRQSLRMLDAGLWLLFGSLVGGRLLYILLAWPYYESHLPEILQVWQGGLSAHGALVGAVIALAPVSLFVRWTLAHTADALLPLFMAVSVSAWLALWLEDAFYGLNDTSWVDRAPVQIGGALLTLAIFALLDIIRGRLALHIPFALPGLARRLARSLSHSSYQDGQAASLALLALSLELSVLSLPQVNASNSWTDPHLEVWIALAVAVFSLAAFLLTFRKKAPETQPSVQEPLS